MSSQRSSKARANGLSLGSFSDAVRPLFYWICVPYVLPSGFAWTRSAWFETVLMPKPGVDLGLFDELSF
jgi:hypothetical protein